MPKFCPLCGRQAKEMAKFCSGCGSKFSSAAAAPPPPAAYQPPSAGVYSPPPTGGQEPAWRDAGAESWSPESPGPSNPAAPPQFWESYDYQSPSPGTPAAAAGYSAPGYEYPGSSTNYRPADASRPLPPLSFEAPASPHKSRDRAREIARNFSLWAAGIVLFPIPFSDLVLLMPIQTAMVIYIGKAYGVKDPPEKMLAHIAAACGASVFGQITPLVVTNLIPIIGKMVSAPFVYGWTYGLGEVAMRYFESQGEISKDEMKSLFKQVSREATRSFRTSEVKDARNSLDHLKDHLSEDDYQKLRSRFSQS